MEQLNLSLKKYFYFPEDLLKEINGVMEVDLFQREHIILNKGQVNHRVYFIVSGLIKIVGEENDKPVIPYILKKNDFVIATDSYFCGDPTECQIIAVEDTEVVFATREQLQMIGRKYPELEIGINKIQASYRKEYEKRNNLLNKMEPFEKYEWFITKKSDLMGRLKDEEIWVYLNMSRNAYYDCKNGKHKGKGGK